MDIEEARGSEGKVLFLAMGIHVVTGVTPWECRPLKIEIFDEAFVDLRS